MASKKAKQVAVDLLGQSQKYVQERLEREKTEEGRKERDIIGLILRDDQHEKDPLAEEEIYTMSVTLVGAGSETTSAALTGLMYYLVQDPGTLKKLTAEVRDAFKTSEDVTVKGVAKLPYLNGAVEEGLRLFIPAPSLPPRVSPPGGHTVNGEWIPGGVNMVMANYHNSHSDQYFSEAERFRPERWLPRDAGGTDGLHVKNAYQAFSYGPRNCVGRLLAHTELRLILAKMVYDFDIELANEVTEWLESAKFFIAWEMKPLLLKFKPRV
ncbi:Averantin hydroxylase [Cyphellophora attinorum]|uniref:Averantin hydroxylase n=1 Tax=Cyphellophora attinorum TaxID=1664694 RepID=A0A0N1H8X9_9EURO|nr:Averantin hydroxylase [Phialophora attinorum]KPI38490.1 Averantin hydroxylase [Phialophora attinorum]